MTIINKILDKVDNQHTIAELAEAYHNEAIKALDVSQQKREPALFKLHNRNADILKLLLADLIDRSTDDVVDIVTGVVEHITRKATAVECDHDWKIDETGHYRKCDKCGDAGHVPTSGFVSNVVISSPIGRNPQPLPTLETALKQTDEQTVCDHDWHDALPNGKICEKCGKHTVTFKGKIVDPETCNHEWSKINSQGWRGCSKCGTQLRV